MRHSPGPWVSHSAKQASTVNTKNGVLIASLARSTHDNHTDDARLIAAAPALLKALIQAEKRLQSLNGPNDAAAIRARSVIRNATGGTE